MDRMTSDMARRFARHVVVVYEDAEARADAFIEQFRPRSHKDNAALRDRLVADFRAMVGGWEGCQAAKTFLRDNCRCKGTGRVETSCGDPQHGDSTWDHDCNDGYETCPDCRPHFDRDAAPWCGPCVSYHVVPRDEAHHRALQCRATSRFKEETP